MGWRASLGYKFKQASHFYAVIVIAVVVGALLNLTGIDPIYALYMSAVVNGIIAPPLILVILFITNNKKIMGNRTNGRRTNILGTSTFVIMTLASSFLLLKLILP